MNEHPIEKLWRECGLPEYFLGNGGTNNKLYALHRAIIEECAKVAMAHKGAAQKARRAKKNLHMGSDDYAEVVSEERGEDIASEIIAREIRALAKCRTCGGRGEVGGFVNSENGYQTDACPECKS